MDAVTVETRLVIEYREKARDVSKRSQWIPPHSNVTEIDGIQYVTVGYSGDRGFARFCGGDSSLSNPLKFHTWLHDAETLRNDAAKIVLDKVAEEKLLGHVHGQPIKNKRKLAEFLPEALKVKFPAMKFEDTGVGPCEFNVKFEFDSNVSLAFESTELAIGYVRVAMLASQKIAQTRARIKHEARLSTRTGVKGVWGAGKGRIKMNVRGADGKKIVKTQKCPDLEEEDDVPGLTVLCKTMKQHPQHASVTVETDGDMEVEEAEEVEESDDDTETRAIASAELEEAKEREKEEGRSNPLRPMVQNRKTMRRPTTKGRAHQLGHQGRHRAWPQLGRKCSEHTAKQIAIYCATAGATARIPMPLCIHQ